MSTPDQSSVATQSTTKRSLLARVGGFLPTFGVPQTVRMTKPMTGLLASTLRQARTLLSPAKATDPSLTFEESVRQHGATDADIADALRYQNVRALLFLSMSACFLLSSLYMASFGELSSTVVHLVFLLACLWYGSHALYRSSQIAARSFAFGYKQWFMGGKWLDGFSLNRVFGNETPRPRV